MPHEFLTCPRMVIRSSVVIPSMGTETTDRWMGTKEVRCRVLETAADYESIRVHSEKDVERLLESGENPADRFR